MALTGSIGSCELFRLAICENKAVKKLKMRHLWNLSTLKKPTIQYIVVGINKENYGFQTYARIVASYLLQNPPI